METLTPTKTHRTSVYIIQDEKGKLYVYTHRPTDPYAGRKDSDQYSLALGLKIKFPSHDLWLGDVECYQVLPSHSGFTIKENLTYKIVAKQSYFWDYSKPQGKRMLEEKKSKQFDEALKFYRDQYK